MQKRKKATRGARGINEQAQEGEIRTVTSADAWLSKTLSLGAVDSLSCRKKGSDGGRREPLMLIAVCACV